MFTWVTYSIFGLQFLYALKIKPVEKMSQTELVVQPPDVTENPYVDSLRRKKETKPKESVSCHFCINIISTLKTCMQFLCWSRCWFEILPGRSKLQLEIQITTHCSGGRPVRAWVLFVWPTLVHTEVRLTFGHVLIVFATIILWFVIYRRSRQSSTSMPCPKSAVPVMTAIVKRPTGSSKSMIDRIDLQVKVTRREMLDEVSHLSPLFI